jgi:hypothetical protein
VTSTRLRSTWRSRHNAVRRLLEATVVGALRPQGAGQSDPRDRPVGQREIGQYPLGHVRHEPSPSADEQRELFDQSQLEIGCGRHLFSCAGAWHFFAPMNDYVICGLPAGDHPYECVDAPAYWCARWMVRWVADWTRLRIFASRAHALASDRGLSRSRQFVQGRRRRCGPENQPARSACARKCGPRAS